MAREIKGPITLRITAAEIIDSQLNADDLRALAVDDGGNDSVSVRCPGVYCLGGWCGPALRTVIPEKSAMSEPEDMASMT